jgi:hypothetical protein
MSMKSSQTPARSALIVAATGSAFVMRPPVAINDRRLVNSTHWLTTGANPQYLLLV